MTLLLLDGYNLLYRSFTSLPLAITAADGQPINAVYGLVSAMLRLVRELEAERVVVALDVPDVPTFRHRLFPGYQAQRGPLGGEQAEEFARQTELARRLLPPAGVPVLSVPGFEADDVMATLAMEAAAAGGQAAIVSTDRDLLQLVRPGIEVVTPGKVLMRAREDNDVIARMGVPPSGIPPFKALAGDPSDNIPGVRGIGTKTAADLVTRYGTLDALFEQLPALTPKTARLLEAERADAYLFLDIVTLRTDIDVPMHIGELPAPNFTADTKVRAILGEG